MKPDLQKKVFKNQAAEFIVLLVTMIYSMFQIKHNIKFEKVNDKATFKTLLFQTK